MPDDVATTNTAIQGGGVREDVCEVPDNSGVHTTNTTTVVNFELTETTGNSVEDHCPPAQTQLGVATNTMYDYLATSLDSY